MTRRKSIGRDPLDWIGEPSSPPVNGGASGGERDRSTFDSDGPARDQSAASVSADGAGAATPAGTLLSLAAPAAEFQLERQLLLVDGMLRDTTSRPRINHLLWTLLLLATFLGAAVVLFHETRRQWTARIVSLERAIDRLHTEKGRNERVLEHVISEKDTLIREKQGAIDTIGALHESTVEELRFAWAENRRLLSEAQSLLERALLSGAASSTPAAPAPAAQPAAAEGNEPQALPGK